MIKDFFIQLIRVGVGTTSEVALPDCIDWPALQALAEQQGLLGVGLDGIDKIPLEHRPKKKDILKWIGITIQRESQFEVQRKAAVEMALLFHNNAIRTYVLKGAVVAECYPNPFHRNSVDMDCFLLPETGDFDAWSLGNVLIKAQGFDVQFDYYKNSTFFLPGLTVENHEYMVPFRGNKKLTKLEKLLQSYLRQDSGEDMMEGSYLCRPPVMVTSLFLVEHAYSHFLHEGLTWRLVLDWVLFSRRHKRELDWRTLDALIDEFGFRKFYDSYYRLGKFLLGELSEPELSKKDLLMLNDIWAPLDLHESVKGFKGKMALVGNTWRARWKYRYFTEMSWIKALWIQVKGYVFIKEPRLG